MPTNFQAYFNNDEIFSSNFSPSRALESSSPSSNKTESQDRTQAHDFKADFAALSAFEKGVDFDFDFDGFGASFINDFVSNFQLATKALSMIRHFLLTSIICCKSALTESLCNELT